MILNFEKIVNILQVNLIIFFKVSISFGRHKKPKSVKKTNLPTLCRSNIVQFCPIISVYIIHIWIAFIWAEGMYMRREYFLLCYKRYREGFFQLRPVSYTHYVYCHMTVMRSRIDNFFFWTVMFLGLVYLFSYRQMQENRWKATLKNTPAHCIHGYFGPVFFFALLLLQTFSPRLEFR